MTPMIRSALLLVAALVCGLPAGAARAQVSGADLTARIARLEQSIRELTGSVEELQHRNQLLEQQLRQIQEGSGGRIQEPNREAGREPARGEPRHSVVRPGLPPPPPPPVIEAPPPAAVPGRRADVFDPSRHPGAPGAPRQLGTVPPGAEPPPPVPEAPVGAPVQETALPNPGGPLPAPPARHVSGTGAAAATLPPSASPKDQYDLGYGYVLRKDYALAEDALGTFLKKYPTDRHAADAQFWLGESMFQRQRYDAAAEQFLQMSTKHAAHPKAADALLRLGESLAALKQKEMACATLAEVGRKYPRASASVKQGVEREQKRVHC
jgi:tol-pal system protein YbgF